MLTRILQPHTVALRSGGEISINRRIAGQIAALSLENAKRLQRTIAKSDDPLQEIELAHQDLDTVDDLLPAVNKLASDLTSAADILSGLPARDTSPLTELCLTTAALTSAIKIAEANADTSDLDDLIDNLRTAADGMGNEYTVLQNRRKKLDTALREIVGIACSRKDLNPTEILADYECPEHWDMEPSLRPKFNLAAALTGHIYDENGNIVPYERPKYDPDGELRNRARRYLDVEKSKATRAHSEKRAKRRRELQSKAREIWSGV